MYAITTLDNVQWPVGLAGSAQAYSEGGARFASGWSNTQGLKVIEEKVLPS